jgi:hypothetical protein
LLNDINSRSRGYYVFDNYDARAAVAARTTCTGSTTAAAAERLSSRSTGCSYSIRTSTSTACTAGASKSTLWAIRTATATTCVSY